MDDVLWLRHALGEEIAEGQTEADTNFVDRDLEDLLEEYDGNRNLAAAADTLDATWYMDSLEVSFS